LTHVLWRYSSRTSSIGVRVIFHASVRHTASSCCSIPYSLLYPLLRPGQVECYDILFTPKRLLPSARERVLVGGPTVSENLALACVSCSLRKEARRSGRDPKTGRTVGLFHPRRQVWARHFRWEGVSVVGLTPTGRATVERLLMNRPLILAIRLEEALRGCHPPRESMVGLPHTGRTKLR
jgi:hypothetical protein